MSLEEQFELTKKEVLGDSLIITSLSAAESLHDKLIDLRVKLHERGIIDVMPHYRGEQNIAWDIRPGIFRHPLEIPDSATGKTLENQAIVEFEKAITAKLGKEALRELFYPEAYGKQWDLLFQAQHAGVKTTLTDWSADIRSALYFATEISANTAIEQADGNIWVLLAKDQAILSHDKEPIISAGKTYYDLDPFNMTGTFIINPPYYVTDIEKRLFENRMFRQKGRFVIPSNSACDIPLNQQTEMKRFLIRVRIPANEKEKIRAELLVREVTEETMYIEPNFDGKTIIGDINEMVFGKYRV